MGRTPSFSTPLTEALGCRYPVIQTAMGWVATSKLVSASIQAGAFGFLAAAVMSPEECESEIKAIKAATDAPFGVNIHSFQTGIDRIVDMCIDYDIAAISYGRAPSAEIIDKVLFFVNQVFDLERVGAVELTQLACEDRLLVAGKGDRTMGRGLQLYDLADAQVANIAKGHFPFLENGLQFYFRPLNLVMEMLCPLLVAG